MSIRDNGSEIIITYEATHVAKTWNSPAGAWGMEQRERDLGEVRLVCSISPPNYRNEPRLGEHWSMYVEHEDITHRINHTVTHNDVAALSEDLEELSYYLYIMCEYNSLDEHIELSELPTFGGPVPRGTMEGGVYSWDHTHVLYFDDGPRLVERWRHDYPWAKSDDDDERVGLIRELRGKGQTEVAEQIRQLIDNEELREAMKSMR